MQRTPATLWRSDMKRSLRTAGFCALMLLVCSVAHAQGPAPGYTYIEAGYLNVHPDDFSGAGDSYYGQVSIGFLKNFHASAQYVTGDYADNLDLSVWNFAAGWHGLLGDKADVVAEATWTDTEIENDSDDG